MRKCGPVALRFHRRQRDCGKQRTMSATSQRIALSAISFRISVVIEVSLDNAASFP